DLNAYMHHVKTVSERDRWETVQRSDIMRFLHTLKDENKSSSTIARFLSSIRLFHRFLMNEQLVTHDATQHIETPKQERKLPDVLSPKDIEALLSINSDKPLNIRNKAML